MRAEISLRCMERVRNRCATGGTLCLMIVFMGRAGPGRGVHAQDPACLAILREIDAQVGGFYAYNLYDDCWRVPSFASLPDFRRCLHTTVQSCSKRREEPLVVRVVQLRTHLHQRADSLLQPLLRRHHKPLVSYSTLLGHVHGQLRAGWHSNRYQNGLEPPHQHPHALEASSSRRWWGPPRRSKPAAVSAVAGVRRVQSDGGGGGDGSALPDDPNGYLCGGPQVRKQPSGLRCVMR